MSANEPARDLVDAIDLCDLAQRYTTLKRWARREWAGPCPRCGGKDRFHVHAEGWWKCYRCHPRRSGAVALVEWAEVCNFRQAIDRLDAIGTRPASPSSARGAAAGQKSGEPGPYNPRWQARAQREAAAAVERLAGPDGEIGRAYLAARGLRPITWETWRLGFALPWHPRLERRLPALVIPWRKNGRILAIQYRFVPGSEADTALSHSDRFSQKRGGMRTVYTLPSGQSSGSEPAGGTGSLAHDAGTRATLVLVEGELNALSIWQALHAYPGPHARPPILDLGPVEVASFGSEGGATAGAVRALAKGYLCVVMWADRHERAEQGAAALRAGGIHAFGIASPAGQDANDLLRAGLLERFLMGVLRP